MNARKVLERELARVKAKRRGKLVTRAGLWLIPVAGWIFLPWNRRAIDKLAARERELLRELAALSS